MKAIHLWKNKDSNTLFNKIVLENIDGLSLSCFELELWVVNDVSNSNIVVDNSNSITDGNRYSRNYASSFEILLDSYVDYNDIPFEF